MNSKTEVIQILTDAISKHGLKSIDPNSYDLQCLVNYVQNIGFNNGWKARGELIQRQELY